MSLISGYGARGSAVAGVVLFSLIAGGRAACGDFIGVGCQLVDLGAPEGALTYRVYTLFDDPEDQVIAVSGTSEHPLVFSTDTVLLNDGGEFTGFKEEDFALFPVAPEWDSWVTIQASTAAPNDTNYSPGFLDTDGEHAVIVGSAWWDDNDGWFDSYPPTRANGGSILIAQFTIAEAGEFALQGNVDWVADDGLRANAFAIGTGGDIVLGACCLDADTCIFTTPIGCDVLGGLFRGDGTECTRQLVQDVCYTGQGFEVCLYYVLECPVDPFAPDGCAPGPYIDALVTADPETDDITAYDFGAPGQAIPAGFFGPGSEPIAHSAAMRGTPLGPVDLGEHGVVDFGAADTLLRRSADPFDRCAAPGEAEVGVDVEVIAMNLRSVVPVRVLFNGGQSFEFWNLEIGLSEVAPEAGTVWARKTSCNGGRYDVVDLLVQPKITFRKFDDPDEVRVLDTGIEGMPPNVLTATGGHWVDVVDTGLTVLSPFCTTYHPGLRNPVDPTDCDCNSNGTLDSCDIEGGTSVDYNGDGIPDECQCPADLDGDDTVGFADLVDLLYFWGPCDACPQDLDADGIVGISDLTTLLINWGPCAQ